MPFQERHGSDVIVFRTSNQRHSHQIVTLSSIRVLSEGRIETSIIVKIPLASCSALDQVPAEQYKNLSA